MDIGTKIKNARIAAQLTQEQVADALGVSRQTMSNWENGKTYPDIVSVIKMSDLYAISLDHLLKEKEEVPMSNYMDYLEESTNTVKSQKKLSLTILLATYLGTLNAHYTSPTVIRGIYDAVERMGFETGNILEPAMGVGNFFGLLPESMRDSRLYGVELDSISGRIAQKLYPKADITVAGFETTNRRDFYDLAVGNVPFGNYKVSDKPYDKLGFSIHNYFFAKTLDQVRPGGVVAFVTSRHTMDSKTPDARKYMAQRADFLGAIRLPNNAFKKNAGTDVRSYTYC